MQDFFQTYMDDLISFLIRVKFTLEIMHDSQYHHHHHEFSLQNKKCNRVFFPYHYLESFSFWTVPNLTSFK